MFSLPGKVYSGSSETPWAGRWISSETSLAAAETLVRWYEADVHKTTACTRNKRLIRRKQLPVDGPWRDRTSLYVWRVTEEISLLADEFCRFYSWSLGSASLSAVQSFFSSGLRIFGEFVRFVLFNGCQNGGVLVRETKKLDSLRFPFEMVLKASSIASSRVVELVLYLRVKRTRTQRYPTFVAWVGTESQLASRRDRVWMKWT